MNAGSRKLTRLSLALAALVVTFAVGATAASAYETGQSLDSDQYAIESFTASASSEVAGGRTDFNTTFEMHNELMDIAPPFEIFFKVPYGRTRNVRVSLPPGLVGNPSGFPTCPRETFLRFAPNEWCPSGTQLGTATVEAWGVGTLTGPIFNLEPGRDEPALFGIKFGAPLYAYINIDVGPDGDLTAVVKENPMGSPIILSSVTMFGVPADHGTGGPDEAFMSNPTNCEGFTATLRTESYEFEEDTMSSSGPPRGGCADVPFDPSMKVAPTSDVAGAPIGLNVDIAVPQSQDPDGLASAHVKDVTMTLPEGMRLSASSANGLGSCSPAEFGYHQRTPVTCPDSAKVGTVEVETPLLDEPLSGPVYVARQDDNPFGSLLALYMAPAGSGVQLKLAGKVDLDPATGRITTTFLNNPQQPFEVLRVRLKDGPRAPLALPRACGTYVTTAELTSWSGKAVPLSDSFAVSQGCGREGAFTPGFSAGTTNPKAGAFSPFTLRITRADDAQANVSRLIATLPEGLLAKLAGVPLCSDADAAAAACPEASKVGHTTVGVGAGPDPVFAPEPGKAPTALYLAGPYNGGPYSLVAEVPAQAGPFDLGTVVLRNALRVDPTTTKVTAVSDPLPQFLRGVPIDYRDIRVDVDRPGFTVNPTSCEPTSVTGTIVSAAGTAVPVSDRFGARACRELAFKPKLRLTLSGATKRAGNPALTAVLTQPPGANANIDAVTAVLPKSQFIDQSHINNPCTRVQFNVGACPPKSVLGTARAYSPLLDRPLEGPVYFRSNGGERELPDLVADLDGPIHVTLVGFIDSVKKKRAEVSRVRTRFLGVPDAPVSRFVLEMAGGRRGLLENSTDVCRSPQRAVIRMDGQNGKSRDSQPVVTASCGKGAKERRAGR